MPLTTAPQSPLELVAWSTIVVAGGRAVLALLPVGDAGLRSVCGAVPTLAPAALAGLACAALAGAAMGANGLDTFETTSAFVLATAVVVALALAALGPAGLVPRHPRVEPRLPLAVVSVSALVAIASLTAAVLLDGRYALALVGAALLEGGLSRASLPSSTIVRRVLAAIVLVIGAAVLALSPEFDAVAAVFALGGLAHASGWVRRADRRDLWLAALAFAALGARDALFVGVAGVVLLVVTTARPKLALAPSATALLALALFQATAEPNASSLGTPATWIVFACAAMLVIAARVRRSVR